MAKRTTKVKLLVCNPKDFIEPCEAIGMLFNLTATLKNLLVLNRNNPLSFRGFDVRVGVSKSPGRRKK